MPESSRREQAMNRRRVDLGLTWRDLAARASVSYETLRAYRKGESAGGELTVRGIERALDWQSGSLARVEAGLAPAPMVEGDIGPQEAAADIEGDRQVDAIMTILNGLPARVQLEVLRQLGDRIPPTARPDGPAKGGKREAG